MVDDGGNFPLAYCQAIGGANKLAQWVGDIIGAIPLLPLPDNKYRT